MDFKQLFTKKYGGVPGWVFFALFVGLLAWYFAWRKKQVKDTSKGGESDTGPTGSNGAGLATFPYAQPMQYDAGTFITTQTPADPLGNVPATVTVPEGSHFETFAGNLNAQYPSLGLTKEKLQQLNPNLKIIASNNRGYLSASNPGDQAGGPIIYSINTGSPSGQVRIK